MLDVEIMKLDKVGKRKLMKNYARNDNIKIYAYIDEELGVTSETARYRRNGVEESLGTESLRRKVIKESNKKYSPIPTSANLQLCGPVSGSSLKLEGTLS